MTFGIFIWVLTDGECPDLPNMSRTIYTIQLSLTKLLF